MNKNWAKIMKVSLIKIRIDLYIYSNGTICPKDEQLEISMGKIKFYLTDYDIFLETWKKWLKF